VEFVFILVVPEDLIESNKPDVLSIVRNTLLHVYVDNWRCVARIVCKETFFKNTTFRGVYFVEEGEV